MQDLAEPDADLRDPSWFLHDIDLSSGRDGVWRAGFVKTDRAALSAEPFLDHRWRPAEAVTAALPLAQLQPAAGAAPQLSFIWHTSYCASTLLSTCLDQPGRCLALKEPRVLVILASLKQAGLLRPGDGLAGSALALLARRFEPDEQILIKPANSANILIPEAAALTQGRMLLLYSDCESFLLATARHGRGGAMYVRDRFRSLAAGGHPIGGWPAAELLRLTDLEMAALVWRMQMDGLEAASLRLGARARSLDCRLFLEDPGEVLRQVDDFLGLGLGAERLRQVAAGPLMARNAKRPGESFDARARAEQEARLRAHLGADLPAVVGWIEQAFPRPPQLAPPLAHEGPGGVQPGARMAAAFG